MARHRCRELAVGGVDRDDVAEAIEIKLRIGLVLIVDEAAHALFDELDALGRKNRARRWSAERPSRVVTARRWPPHPAAGSRRRPAVTIS